MRIIVLGVLLVLCVGCTRMTKALLFVEPNFRTCSSLELDKCRPIPVRDIARLTFCIPDSGRVRLVIQNVSYGTVATVVDSTLCPDAYALEWDSRGQPPGIYYAQLTWRNIVRTKKFSVRR